jgi:Cys-tRNA(Pro)/Cys-tRNA(Cys) deacylase
MASSGKTNALRILESHGIEYESREYELKDGFTSGSDIARMQNMDPDTVFKTLVTESNSGEHFVCVIPVDCELDMKKAAKHFGAKKMDMLPMKKLFPLTGYVHGGCSPVGMKKAFVTAIDDTAQLFEKIYVSGGRVGLQLKIAPDDLVKITGANFADLTVV